MKPLNQWSDVFVCPETKRPLRLCTLDEAEREASVRFRSRTLTSRGVEGVSVKVQADHHVLLRDDLRSAYPLVNTVPVLLVPEMLCPAQQPRVFDLGDPRYAEAYQEMDHYNRVSTQQSLDIKSSESFRIIEPLLKTPSANLASFPKPCALWADAAYDCAAQVEAYAHIAPLRGKRVLQLGGMGIHAVKFLLAGAEQAWVVSPMLGEMRCALALAQAAGVVERLRCAVCIAEELPFHDQYFDAVYSGGCVHHMVTPLAFPEMARVLRSGGRFAAVDPWKTPLHSVGTRIFGKREANVYCRPLTEKRIEPLKTSFAEHGILHHGALFRYPLLALNKLGLRITPSLGWYVSRLDDSISSCIPKFRRRFGGSTALLATK